MKRIILVRHGESAWNSVRRLQGQADIGLSARGEAQATALRATIEAMRPDHVIASDLLRARHTAALLGYPHAQLSPALREIDVGDWTGRAIGDLMAEDQDAYLGWRAGTYAPRGGERWQEFRDRVTAGLGKAVSIPEKGCLSFATVASFAPCLMDCWACRRSGSYPSGPQVLQCLPTSPVACAWRPSISALMAPCSTLRID